MAVKKRTILITGASSGVGAALAEEFSGSNHRLVLLARNESRLDAVADTCRSAGSEVVVRMLDVCDAEAVEACVAELEQKFPVDMAIANAGIMESVDEPRTLEPVGMTMRQMHTNYGGAVNVAVAVASRMRTRRNGQIVLVASQAGLQPVADLPGYSASKAATISYGEALGNFLKPDGVVVTVVSPGFITTPMLDGYENFRPFEMSARDAARRIRKAAESRRRYVEFPFLLALVARLGRLLPAALRYYATRPFNFVK